MKPELFGLLDLIIGFGWFILIVVIGLYFRLRNRDKPHFKYFMPLLFFKLGFAFLFGLAYAVVIEDGGDTLAYWDGAVKLNQLFWDSPTNYLIELSSTPTSETITDRFNLSTGYPPSWIYIESESFFVCKIISVFTFFTLNSYLALTFVISIFAVMTSWKFYELVKDFKFCPNWVLVFATLFIPTVAFWCSGLSKDTLVLGALLMLLYHLFNLITGKKKFNLSRLFLILFSLFLLYNLRSFMIIAVFTPLIIAVGVRLIKSISQNKVLVYGVKALLYSLAIIVVLYFMGFLGGEGIEGSKYLKEVANIQKDFAQNKLYTGYRYDLGITDYSTTGMLLASPIAIITAFFRPFIWEANSVFLIISGLEGLILLFFVFRFFFLNGNFLKHLAFIRSQEFLIFSIIFVLLLGFFVGFTSGLFNVLVRFKAPLMVFLFIFFASRRPRKIEG
ncbi:MAG: hypothetical protein COA32_00940 [Fluviicola sp.]|nr:MAG: hypothetical protein COA32_00940 [Fluviicola sp.]